MFKLEPLGQRQTQFDENCYNKHSNNLDLKQQLRVKKKTSL